MKRRSTHFEGKAPGSFEALYRHMPIGEECATNVAKGGMYGDFAGEAKVSPTYGRMTKL